MSMNVRVKMEYPFPQNRYAFLVKEWEEVTDENDLLEASMEINAAVENQKRETAWAMGKVLNGFSGDESIEQIVSCWELIEALSNLIRCYSTLLGVRGEQFGLKVLLDSLEEG